MSLCLTCVALGHFWVEPKCMVDNVGEPVLPIRPVGWGGVFPPHRNKDINGLAKPPFKRYNIFYGVTCLPNTWDR